MSQDVSDSNARVVNRGKKPLRRPDRPLSDRRSRSARRFVMSVSDLENEEEVRETILSRLRQAVACRSVWEEEWHRIILAWLQRPSTDKEDGWESNRFLPIIFKQQETAVPIIVAATLDANGAFRMEAMTPDGMDTAAAQEALVNWQVTGTSGAMPAYERMFFWSSLIGTGYIDHFWDFRRERRVVPKVVVDPRTKKRVKRMLEADMVVANTPRVKALNPLDVWPDPDSEVGDDNEWYIVRVKTTIGKLRDLGEQGGHIDADALEKWLDDARPGDKPLSTEQNDAFAYEGAVVWADWLKEADAAVGNDEPRSDDKSDGEKAVMVLRYVSKHETVTLGDRTHIIGFSRNPDVHGKTGIITHQFVEVPNSPFGRGLGHVLLGHQELANQNINVWMDTAMLELMAPVIADKSKVSVLEEDFIWEPNKLIRARGIDAVKRLDMPAPTDLALKVDAHLARDADDATGFAAQARGVPGAASQTATAFQGLTNNLNTRLLLHIRRSGRTLAMSGQLLVDLNAQYLDGPQVVTLRGEDAVDYKTVSPEEIVGRSVVKASINAGRADPQALGARLIQFLQIIVPLLQAGLHKDPIVSTLLRSVAEKLDVENADKLFPKVFTRARDPLFENAYISVGGHIDPLPTEDHWSHAQAHLNAPGGVRDLEARAAAGEDIPPATLIEAKRHLQAHLDMAQQMGAAAASGQPLPAGAMNPNPAAAGLRAPPGSPQALAGPAGANGTPGVAPPGPPAPAGRPL